LKHWDLLNQERSKLGLLLILHFGYLKESYYDLALFILIGEMMFHDIHQYNVEKSGSALSSLAKAYYIYSQSVLLIPVGCYILPLRFPCHFHAQTVFFSMA